MPSSIFSSSRHVPRGVAVTLLTAATLAIGVLAMEESVLRRHGFQPSAKDGPELWALQRQRADDLGPRGIALVGSSRFLIGLAPGALEDELKRPVAQLAIDGGSPLPALRDLAADENFRGSVLCEVLPTASFGMEFGHATEGFVQAFRRRSWIADAEQRARLFFQLRLVILLPQANLRQIVMDSLFLRHPLSRPFERTLGDRSKPADFELIDQRAAEARFTDQYEHDSRTPTELEWHARLAEVNDWVRRIQGRGGTVAFVRMISTGTVRAVEDSRFPRSRYWDMFAAQSIAPAIHTADVPTLRDWNCPDGSHLDRSSRDGFSRALAAELRRRRLF